MKKNIHPKNNEVNVRCACGHNFKTTSTEKEIDIDICSACHPFFTGQQKFIDTAGRIEKFQKKYAKNSTKKEKKAKTVKK
ncbi:50S ribosomal protein L31 [Candidatus Dependentiae bacterium]|nr:50S ribosomal protein L31 [Candidatus Dependentiae bacterium]